MAMPPSSGMKIMRTLRWPITRNAAMWPSSCSATTAVNTTASTSPRRDSPNSGHRINADTTAKPSCVIGRSNRPPRANAPVSAHCFSRANSRRMMKKRNTGKASPR